MQTGIQRIEECIHITDGRRPIGPRDVIRIVLISYNVFFLWVANQPPCHALEGALNAISMRVNGAKRLYDQRQKTLARGI